MTNKQTAELQRALGEKLFDLLLTEPSDDVAKRFELPRCPYCKRRPELRMIPGSSIKMQVRPGSLVTVNVPKYEVASCCSARYTKIIEHATRLQKIRANTKKQEAVPQDR